eukprot:gnl/TRDRNA2_/TRDRNA2_157616_c0_seq1.p1 gnl/TRDRNA2_/TRDRNA2_157616_c0~~gnl/TRDRNA2_/TRDRNA2_157616_c0_seq1.p1  ORF type:complete len:183 (+),score=23.58 gnl/TRDRNA2_/TRDRNA2_157616_c0_seq1:51-551(+)
MPEADFSEASGQQKEELIAVRDCLLEIDICSFIELKHLVQTPPAGTKSNAVDIIRATELGCPGHRSGLCICDNWLGYTTRRTMTAVAIIFGRRPVWQDAAKLFGERDLPMYLAGFNAENTESDTVKQLREFPLPTPAEAKEVPLACAACVRWVLAVKTYAEVVNCL